METIHHVRIVPEHQMVQLIKMSAVFVIMTTLMIVHKTAQEHGVETKL